MKSWEINTKIRQAQQRSEESREEKAASSQQPGPELRPVLFIAGGRGETGVKKVSRPQGNETSTPAPQRKHGEDVHF